MIVEFRGDGTGALANCALKNASRMRVENRKASNLRGYCTEDHKGRELMVGRGCANSALAGNAEFRNPHVIFRSL
jgi:hypothetical protein